MSNQSSDDNEYQLRLMIEELDRANERALRIHPMIAALMTVSATAFCVVVVLLILLDLLGLR